MLSCNVGLNMFVKIMHFLLHVCQFNCIFETLRALWGHLRGLRAHLKSLWARFGGLWADFGGSWGNFGGEWVQFLYIRVTLGLILGPVGAKTHPKDIQNTILRNIEQIGG